MLGGGIERGRSSFPFQKVRSHFPTLDNLIMRLYLYRSSMAHKQALLPLLKHLR
ncbi:MAG: hypothetical protein HC849_01750 [Oscillatoriales cyanobacterium RU_3_3]|nr:hypothetical protein [Oscillatoriales cyanobacterium RU_3_3]NJR24246.1 hypothetical protein [Richelia sp. CSU_2_1]